MFQRAGHWMNVDRKTPWASPLGVRFDMLKLIVVRSTVKPKEKSPEEKSKN